MRRCHSLAVAAALLCAACGPTEQFDFNFDVYLQGVSKTLRAVVMVNGVEQPTPGGKPPWPMRIRGGHGPEYLDSMLPQVAVRYLYPCGWKEMRVKSQHLPPAGVDVLAAAREKRAISMYLDVEEDYGQRTLETLTLYVDNRGGPQVQLKLGQAEAQVPADQHQVLEFPVDTRCAEASQLLLDGKPLSLPVAHGHYLIDTSARHCYSQRAVRYYSQERLLLDPSPRDAGEQVVALPAQPLHKLAGAVSFLEPPPSTITTYDRPHAPTKEVSVAVIEDDICVKGRSR